MFIEKLHLCTPAQSLVEKVSFLALVLGYCSLYMNNIYVELCLSTYYIYIHMHISLYTNLLIHDSYHKIFSYVKGFSPMTEVQFS